MRSAQGEAAFGTLADLLPLAKLPNVAVKATGAPGYSGEAYPFGDMTPHLRRVFDAFGPRRCYWGTDLTAAPNKSTYRQRVTHFTETLDFLSDGRVTMVAAVGYMDWEFELMGVPHAERGRIHVHCGAPDDPALAQALHGMPT